MENIRRVDILGCPFDAISFQETVGAVRRAAIGCTRLQVVPGSVDFVMKAMRDRTFRDVLRAADLVVADGVPITWSAALLGTPIRGRVSGTELVWECARISAETSVPVALIGAMPGVARRAAKAMRERYPGAILHAIPTPHPLAERESRMLAARIRDLRAGIVLAALGAPRQERWIQTYLEDCGASVGIGVGSAFDIICGDKPRAPGWMQNMGLEWLHRTALEPRRLARRYLVEDTPFLVYLAGEVARRRLLQLGGQG